ncbi:MAG: hemolysin family protein [Nitrospiraceae bacterium]|nr:hemolysin family protein [Nitrospiraceae bacterium]
MVFLELLFILLLILINGYFAASEVALISLRKSRVRQLVKSGNRTARRVMRLQEEPERFLATAQIGVTLVGSLASALGGVIAIEQLKPLLADVPVEFISRGAEPIAVGIVVSGISYVTLVAGELVPKSLAIRYSEQIAFFTAAPLDGLSRLFRFVLKLLVATNRAVLGMIGIADEEHTPALVSEDEVKYLIREGRKSGVFESTEEDLIHSVFKFADTVVREVMVPRTDIVAVAAGSDLDTIVKTMNEKGFSRLPVYLDTIDNIVGIVYLKDILAVKVSGGAFRLDAVLRKPYVVPPNKKVMVLLKEMRERRIHLALVGDEYGGIDGLVALEDLIEEIVGDIRDEQEKELKDIDEVAVNRYIIDGKTDIGKVNLRLGVSIPEDEFETLGGFILGLFGRLPAEGDQIRHQNLLFTVLRLRKNRIARVRVLKYTEEPKEPEDHEDADRA